MQVSEILRQIADVVDQQETTAAKQVQAAEATKQVEIAAAVQDAQELQAGQVAQMVNAASNAKQAATTTAHNIADPMSEVPTEVSVGDTMVPPLQQKHELLKKATDVENNVDAFATSTDNDELAMMRKMAGIGQEQSYETEQEINPRKEAALTHFRSDNYDAE